MRAILLALSLLSSGAQAAPRVAVQLIPVHHVSMGMDATRIDIRFTNGMNVPGTFILADPALTFQYSATLGPVSAVDWTDVGHYLYGWGDRIDVLAIWSICEGDCPIWMLKAEARLVRQDGVVASLRDLSSPSYAKDGWRPVVLVFPPGSQAATKTVWTYGAHGKIAGVGCDGSLVVYGERDWPGLDVLEHPLPGWACFAHVYPAAVEPGGKPPFQRSWATWSTATAIGVVE